MINELIGSEEDSRPSRTRARTGHPASVLVVVLMASALLAGCGKTKAGPPVDTAAPVVVAAATQRDVPVDVKVVGTVEAYSNVQVKSMIAGEITRLGFAEGQDVRKGSLLFEIDPRPYRAALAQAEGNLARDLAQEANARAQAARYEALYKQGVVFAPGHQSESCAAIVDEVELGIAPAPDQLFLLFGLGPGLVHRRPHDLRIDREKRPPDVAREGEILVPIGLQIIVEDAADAARLAPVLDEEIFFAPFREALVIIGAVRVAGACTTSGSKNSRPNPSSSTSRIS